MPEAPDLLVVCPSCGAEASQYVTECPYCGARLRKRAPQIARGQIEAASAKPKRSRRRQRSRRPDRGSPDRGGPASVKRPLISVTLAASCAVGALLLVPGVLSVTQVGVVGPLDGQWWRLVTASFFTDNLWYAAAGVVAIALFGGLIERQHGPLAVLSCFALCAVGGIAAAVGLETVPLALGANAAGLGLIGAYVVTPIAQRRRGEQPDSDLIGVAVCAAVLLAMPLVVDQASPTAGIVGLLLGLLYGAILARRSSTL